MLLKSSTVQLAQPIENDDEIFLLHCGEAKAFMGRGCYHGLNHTLGEMYQEYVHIEGCRTSGIGVDAKVGLHLTMFHKVGIFHAGMICPKLAVVAGGEQTLKCWKYNVEFCVTSGVSFVCLHMYPSFFIGNNVAKFLINKALGRISNCQCWHYIAILLFLHYALFV